MEKSTERMNTFGKMESTEIKGIAILLMLAHHLWAISSRIPTDYPINYVLKINGEPWYAAVGSFGKICIGLFSFAAGYALYQKYRSGSLNIVRRIIKVYLSYWKVFIIAIPVAFIFYGDQVYLRVADSSLPGRFSEFRISECVANFWGISYSYNTEWWFLGAYVILTLLGGLYVRMTRRTNSAYLEIFIVIIINTILLLIQDISSNTVIFNSIVSPTIFYQRIGMQEGVAAYFSGIVFSKYDLFGKLSEKAAKLPAAIQIVISASIIYCSFYIRVFYGWNRWDIITAPMFIFSALNILSFTGGAVHRVLFFFGKHSTNMWLLHTFFCYYISKFVVLVYASGNAVIDYLVLLGLTLAGSFVVDEIYRWLNMLFNSRKVKEEKRETQNGDSSKQAV